MKIKNIFYTKEFAEQFKLLPEFIKKKAVRCEKLFRENPFYPSLRLHKLKGKLDGLWSISLNRKYRIIFKVMENGDVLFISAGIHSIYESN